MSGLPLYRRALKQPHHAKRVFEVARNEGFLRTYNRVRGMLDFGTPTGYSAAGIIIDRGPLVDGFLPGDRVACAGAGVANHAEVIAVPVNLAARIPGSLDTAHAATVALGAIALHGVRRAEPTLGETIGVVGLGIVGQLTAQLLAIHGCRVIGVDVDPARVDLAISDGMAHGVFPDEDYAARVTHLTDGFGADAVIVTAATSSSAVIQSAMQACRKKGRVVVVGDVGLHVQRADMYAKELDLRMSTSYGPGRYDAVYEQQGHDYPLPYVRWTENRNMETYLQLLADAKISLANIKPEIFPVTSARAAYAALSRDRERPLVAILSYGAEPQVSSCTTRLRELSPRDGLPTIALIGAGSFATSTHLPNLLKMRKSFHIGCVVSRTGSKASSVAKRVEAAYATTDVEAAFADPEISVVFITTRHDLHADLVLRALTAGKYVFVEKPLALNRDDLRRIADFYGTGSGPLLMTGFNRRFAPAVRRAREILCRAQSPLIVNYRLNAGRLPPDHWIHGPEGGGRNIGEACHVYDLFNFLTRSAVVSVHAEPARPRSRCWDARENFVATVGYDDGSVCTLTYTAFGHPQHPKEEADIYADGDVISLRDYKILTSARQPAMRWRSRRRDKGHLAQLHALEKSIRAGGPWPIPLEDQISAMEIAFAVEDHLGG